MLLLKGWSRLERGQANDEEDGLLFCCVDLGFADNCAEDPVVERQAALTHSATDDANESEAGHECFCCCRHIVHEPFFQVQPITSPPRVAALAKIQAPGSSLQTIFRPPRV